MPKPLFKIKIKTPKTSTELLLTKDEVTVGRSSENEVSIESVGISRKHLKIHISDGEISLTDLGSTNGTFYKGKKLMANLPATYFGGPFNLGPTSDGNVVEIVQESAVKEGTQTFTQAKALARPEPNPEPKRESVPEAKPAAKKMDLKLEQFSHESSRSMSVIDRRQHVIEDESASNEPIKELDPRKVEALNQKLDGKDTPSVMHTNPGQEALVQEKAPEPAKVPEPAKPWDTKSENSIMLSVSRQLEVKAELERLRVRQVEVEKELRDAEIKKHEVEDQIRTLRMEMTEQENRLSGLRDKIKDEDARFRKKTVELEESFQREETYFKGRREEMERDQKAVEKLHKETVSLKAELAETKEKLEKELESEKAHFSKEHDKLMKEHRAEKDRLTEELRERKEKLEESFAKQKSELEANHEALVKRLTSEQVALTRKLDDESERARAESEREKKRLSEDLKDHRQHTEKETARLTEEHEAAVARLTEEEGKLRKVFEAQQKTQKIQLETLTAEIELREAQEKKVIEQRKTEKVVAERELGEVKKAVEESQKDLDRLTKEVAAATERLEKRRTEEAELKKEIGIHEDLKKKLQTEFKKLGEQVDSKKETLAKLEADLIEQHKKNKQDRETAVKLAQEEKNNIILQGRKEAEAHEFKTRKAMDEFQAATRKTTLDELAALRAEAQEELDSDIEEWKADLAAKKSRELNEMNLWAADEKKKLQDRLSGDLDAFVDSVTRTALSKVGQNPQFASLIHEFHGKFAIELKNALTSEGNETVAPFNPDRKHDIKSFWVKSAVASVIVVVLGVAAYYAPSAIREAAHERRASRDDGATGEWIKKIQAEREQRLALKLETRSDFQLDYASNVLYNEGYLEMKLDTGLQSAWVRELNILMTGEKAMGMDEEALVDYVRIEHSLFTDLADKKAKMNGINKDDMIAQMKAVTRESKQELLGILKTKTLPSSDRARLTSPDQKWNAIRALEQRFYNEQVANTRRPASKSSE